MNDQEINIAIAEACGWTDTDIVNKGGKLMYGQTEVPDYCNDLNDMHEAEKILTDEQHRMFRNQLFFITYYRKEGCTESMAERERVSAPPRNRSEAFLQAIGKWKEEK